VRATVRDPKDPSKIDHLSGLPGAKERLSFYAADLMQEGSFAEALASCSAVFHTASPFFFANVTDPDKQLLDPAVQGTENVLRSCLKTESIKRVILTSSTAAIAFNGGKLPDSHVYSEADWSNEEYMRTNKSWYPLSKTLAERAAWKFVEVNKPHFKLVVINPTLVIGPPLQPSLNTSSDFVVAYCNGSKKEIANSSMSFVDVRDVAIAHLLALEKEEAEGRYVCIGGVEHWREWTKHLRNALPEEKKHLVPTEVSKDAEKPAMLSDTSKLRSLGWNPVSLENSLVHSIPNYLRFGFLP